MEARRWVGLEDMVDVKGRRRRWTDMLEGRERGNEVVYYSRAMYVDLSTPTRAKLELPTFSTKPRCM
jgi:hypothetical protein